MSNASLTSVLRTGLVLSNHQPSQRTTFFARQFTRGIMQKSAVLVAKGKELEVQQTDIPKPGKAQILVKIESAAFNPVDYKIQKNGRFFETFPRVIGGGTYPEDRISITWIQSLTTCAARHCWSCRGCGS